MESTQNTNGLMDVGSLQSENAVNIQMPTNDGSFPMLITPNSDIDFLDWAIKCEKEINEALTIFGAILFRGFDIGNPQRFNQLFKGIMGESIEYKNRTSPRKQVFENIYTSTNHPKDQQIHMHTENSYSQDYIRIIAFFCSIPPSVRGETPIADERKILDYLDPNVLEEFRQKKILYVRNVMSGVGLDWQTTYQTSDKTVVNNILEGNGVDYEWISDDHLRLKWVLPAFQTHPITGKEMWFNHMYFYHKSQYDPDILEYFEEEDIPFAAYYGDGSIIDDSIVQSIREFYSEKSIVFKWEKDDFLLLDNMMFSHGRHSYEGDRSILTAMSQPLRFNP